MRPVLFTMAAVNVVLLGVCGYLLLVPAGGPRIIAAILSQAHPSTEIVQRFVPASVSQEQRSNASLQKPVTPRRVILAASATGDVVSSFAEERRSASLEADGNTGEDGVLEARQDGRQRASFGQAAGQFAPVNEAAPAVSVPLAFTTPADGATPSQAAVLGRLQKEFVDNIGGPNQNPNDPAYAPAWQAAQAVSDSNFEEQFGTQAFVQAQLAQVHGGAN